MMFNFVNLFQIVMCLTSKGTKCNLHSFHNFLCVSWCMPILRHGEEFVRDLEFKNTFNPSYL